MAVHTDRFFQRRHRRNDSARRTVRSGGNVNAPPLGGSRLLKICVNMRYKLFTYMQMH